MRQIFHQLRNSFLSHPIVQKRPYIAEFIKFVLVGFINLTIDFSLYLILTRLAGIDYLWANVLSFTAATVNSFIFNKKWTFRNTSKNYQRQYLQFYLVSGVGLGLNQIMLFLLVDKIHIYDLVAKASAVVVVTFWNYSANRVWTFKKIGE